MGELGPETDKSQGSATFLSWDRHVESGVSLFFFFYGLRPFFSAFWALSHACTWPSGWLFLCGLPALPFTANTGKEGSREDGWLGCRRWARWQVGLHSKQILGQLLKEPQHLGGRVTILLGGIHALWSTHFGRAQEPLRGPGFVPTGAVGEGGAGNATSSD